MRAVLVVLALYCAASCVPTDSAGDATSFDTSASDVVKSDVDQYVAGLEKSGAKGWVTVKLVVSDPIPQDTGFYTWTVEVHTTEGEPLTGAEVIAKPTMPDHEHGTYPPTTTGKDEGGGRYRLEEMNLFMPGVWQIEIRVNSEADDDTVVYRFDLEG